MHRDEANPKGRDGQSFFRTPDYPAILNTRFDGRGNFVVTKFMCQHLGSLILAILDMYIRTFQNQVLGQCGVRCVLAGHGIQRDPPQRPLHEGQACGVCHDQQLRRSARCCPRGTSTSTGGHSPFETTGCSGEAIEVDETGSDRHRVDSIGTPGAENDAGRHCAGRMA